MRRNRVLRALAAAGLGVGAVGALAIVGIGCHGEPPGTSPSEPPGTSPKPYDGAWILSRQYRQKGGEPDPPSPDTAIRYRFDSASHRCQVKWETFGQPDSPVEKFNGVFTLLEERPGVLRLGDPKIGFDEYAYSIKGNEMTLEIVNSTIHRDSPAPPPPLIEVRMEEGKEVGREVRPDAHSGPPSVMILTRSP